MNLNVYKYHFVVIYPHFKLYVWMMCIKSVHVSLSFWISLQLSPFELAGNFHIKVANNFTK